MLVMYGFCSYNIENVATWRCEMCGGTEKDDAALCMQRLMCFDYFFFLFLLNVCKPYQDGKKRSTFK